MHLSLNIRVSHTTPTSVASRSTSKTTSGSLQLQTFTIQSTFQETALPSVPSHLTTSLRSRRRMQFQSLSTNLSPERETLSESTATHFQTMIPDMFSTTRSQPIISVQRALPITTTMKKIIPRIPSPLQRKVPHIQVTFQQPFLTISIQ